VRIYDLDKTSIDPATLVGRIYTAGAGTILDYDGLVFSTPTIPTVLYSTLLDTALSSSDKIYNRINAQVGTPENSPILRAP